MDDREVWAVLARGAATVQTQVLVDGRTEPRLNKYNGLLDPSGAEQLAGALAERLGGRGATLVALWEDVEDIVLGHVIARQLGVPVLRTFNADGLVGHVGPLQLAARTILVSDCIRDSVGPRAVRALLERSGGELLGVAGLVDARLAEWPALASLVSLPSSGGTA